jgi:hypothetical protein
MREDQVIARIRARKRRIRQRLHGDHSERSRFWATRGTVLRVAGALILLALSGIACRESLPVASRDNSAFASTRVR